MEYRLTTPCTAQDLAPLRAGDTVLLSGVVYTARDQAHKRMIEAMFKAFAKALDQAVSYNPKVTDVLSTKGSL